MHATPTSRRPRPASCCNVLSIAKPVPYYGQRAGLPSRTQQAAERNIAVGLFVMYDDLLVWHNGPAMQEGVLRPPGQAACEATISTLHNKHTASSIPYYITSMWKARGFCKQALADAAHIAPQPRLQSKTTTAGKASRTHLSSHRVPCTVVVHAAVVPLPRRPRCRTATRTQIAKQ